jgi:hypothetical protein
MPWTVEYEPERALVVVTGAGEIKDEDATAQATEAICYLKQNHANAMLVDYSGAVSEVSPPTLYWLPDYCSELGAPWNIRVAVLLPRTQYRVESFHFFELVCKNAGYHVRLFETIEAAEAWLAEVLAPLELAGQAVPARTALGLTGSFCL